MTPNIRKQPQALRARQAGQLDITRTGGASFAHDRSRQRRYRARVADRSSDGGDARPRHSHQDRLLEPHIGGGLRCAARMARRLTSRLNKIQITALGALILAVALDHLRLSCLMSTLESGRDVLLNRLLRSHRVDRHDGAFEIGHVQKRRDRGDFVGLAVERLLGRHQPGFGGVNGKQMLRSRTVLRRLRTAQRLAVDRHDFRSAGAGHASASAPTASKPRNIRRKLACR